MKVHKKYNLTTFIVTHDLAEVFKLSNKVIKLKEGKITDIGRAEDLFLNSKISGKYKIIGRILSIQKADIVNITSVAIRYGAPTATIYAAAKSAIDAFTRGMAKELAPKIKVNAVAPGFIDTTFHDNGITSQARIDQAIAATPLEMAGQSMHIAKTIKFILENDFLTGETIDVNGGLWMR